MSKPVSIAIVACAFALAATGEEQTLRFTYTQSEQQIQEIATLIRAIGNIPELSVDTRQPSLAVRGTAEQLALAGWLVNELDRPADQRLPGREYKFGDGPDNVVRVVYLNPALTIQQFQEMLTAVRSIVEIRRLFTYQAARAVAMRGTPAQMALAQSLFTELENPHVPGPEYTLDDAKEPVIRVLYLTRNRTIQEFQEIATLIRSIGDIRYLFTFAPHLAMLVRGTADQIALAAWLAEQLDVPEPNAGQHEYRMTASPDDVVRLFYLNPGDTVSRLQQLAVQVRTETEARRLFTVGAARAIALRGTADQIARAQRMIAERDH